MKFTNIVLLFIGQYFWTCFFIYVGFYLARTYPECKTFIELLDRVDK